MKSITFNRILIAFMLLYFPIATVGETGSFWRGLQSVTLLLAFLCTGFTEGKRRRPTDQGAAGREGGA